MIVRIPWNKSSLKEKIEYFNKNYVVVSSKEWNNYSNGAVLKVELKFLSEFQKEAIVITQKEVL